MSLFTTGQQLSSPLFDDIHAAPVVTKPETLPVPTNSNVLTMCSSQFASLLGYDKSEVNRKIKAMFPDEIANGKIPSVDSRYGGVDEYHLPEVEANMFVAKWDINHLRTVSEYFVNGKAPAPTYSSDPAIAQMQMMIENRESVLALEAKTDTLSHEVQDVRDELDVLGSKVEDMSKPEYVEEEAIPNSFITIGGMYDRLREYKLSKDTIRAVIEVNRVEATLFNVYRNGFVHKGVEHFDKETMNILISTLMREAEHIAGTKYKHTHRWVAEFQMLPQ